MSKHAVLICLLAFLGLVAKPVLSQQPPPKELQEARTAAANRDYAVAIEKFSKANKKLNRACLECYARMAQANIALFRYKEALQNADSMLRYATSAAEQGAAHALRGAALARMAEKDDKRLPQAEEAYRAAALLRPDNPSVQFSLAVVLLRAQKDAEGVRILKEIAPRLQGRESAVVARMIEKPSLARKPFPPYFSFSTTDGRQVNWETIAGKVVVLDFWATWCPPCVASVSRLKKLDEKYKGQDFLLVSISSDAKADKWEQFIAKEKMTWPQYRDADHSVGRLFDVPAIPLYYVLDRDGTVYKIVLEDFGLLEDEVKRALEGKPPRN